MKYDKVRIEDWQRHSDAIKAKYAAIAALKARKLEEKIMAKLRKKEDIRAKRQKKLDKVLARVIALKKQGLSMRKIAVKLNFSAQWVALLVKKMKPEDRALFTARRAEIAPRPCEYCGNVFLVHINNKQLKKRTWCYRADCCTKNHSAKLKYPNAAARIQYWREYRKNQWKNDPVFRAKHTATVNRRRKEVMADPALKAHYIEVVRRNVRKYLERVKTDPNRLAKYKKRMRISGKKRYLKLKSDPVKYAEYLRKGRERVLRRKQKLLEKNNLSR